MSEKSVCNRSRREFLKKSGVLTAGAVLSSSVLATPRVHAAEANTIKVAIVGCGGRGNGAISQALSADPNVVLWSIGDVFEIRSQNTFNDLKKDLEENHRGHQFQVTPDRMFSGFDAYKKVMDMLNPGDVILLTSVAAFRWVHFAYAVEKGLHVFAEKPVAVDVPGLKALQAANKIAKAKDLKIGVGLNNRHHIPTEEVVQAIQDGTIGDIRAIYAHRIEAPHHIGSPDGQNVIAHQLRHHFNFNWTSGGFLVDALIHHVDICCWAINEQPVAAQGQGGRVIRKDKDQLIDHAAVEYYFADGRRMTVHTKCMDGIWLNGGCAIHATKGSAFLGEGVYPRLFDHNNPTRSGGNPIWTPKSKGNNSYQTEHDRFFKALRENQPWNEMDRAIDATFVMIMGRMSVDTGQYVTAEAAWNSMFQYVPNLANLTFDSTPPAVPDENGDYPQPIPGKTTI